MPHKSHDASAYEPSPSLPQKTTTPPSSLCSSNLPSSPPQKMTAAASRPASYETPPVVRLRDLMTTMTRLTKQGLPTILWVEAVLFSVKTSPKGIALELVDKDSRDASQAASLGVFAFQKVIQAIETLIGCPLESLAGSEVRLLIKPTFHPRYHLQGEVRDIDPCIVEGLLAQRLDAARKKLKSAGLYGLQKKLRAPAEITGLIIIHPANSAGWADVAGRLQSLEAIGLLRLYNLPAAFEGAHAVPEISHALAMAQGLAWQGTGDLILLIRGGGAASGLAPLMDAGLAEQVCLMSVPVITGTGHAINHSVIDEIAWRAEHTPSYALGVVLRILQKRAGDAWHDWELIGAKTRDWFEQGFKGPLGDLRRVCEELARLCLKDALAGLDATIGEIVGRRNALPRECTFLQAQIDDIITSVSHDCVRLMRDSQAKLDELRLGCRNQIFSYIVSTVDDLSRNRDSVDKSSRSLLDLQRELLRSTSVPLIKLLHAVLDVAEQRLQQLQSAIGSMSLDGTLQRGFCIALQHETVLRTAVDAEAAHCFKLLFCDGFVHVQIDRLDNA